MSPISFTHDLTVVASNGMFHVRPQVPVSSTDHESRNDVAGLALSHLSGARFEGVPSGDACSWLLMEILGDKMSLYAGYDAPLFVPSIRTAHQRCHCRASLASRQRRLTQDLPRVARTTRQIRPGCKVNSANPLTVDIYQTRPHLSIAFKDVVRPRVKCSRKGSSVTSCCLYNWFAP